MPFLTARWIDLAMLNYEIEPEILSPFLPACTELGSFGGRALVSVVGFRFLEARVRGLAIPFHRNFEEINLRFYVRHRGPEGWRRGVVFVKEIVPRRAIALVARAVYGENYVALPTRHVVESGGTAYEWKFRGEWQRLAVTVEGEAYLPEEGSEEQFITEHYWGYTKRRNGASQYRVEHPRWRIRRAAEAELRCDVKGLYGERFAPFLSGKSRSAFLAEGSEVVVHGGRRIPAADIPRL